MKTSTLLTLAVVVMSAACRDAPNHVERTSASVPASTSAQPSGSVASSTNAGGLVFLFIRIPAAIQPLERGTKYEEPLDALLKENALGEVTVGGTGLTKSGEIDYVGVDVDVADATRALPIIKAKLREIGAPKGTVIEEHQKERVVTHSVW